jgi:DNA-directed RNA polymerase subunit RPC12/RpoP
MDTGEAPKPVVPLTQAQAYQPPAVQANFFQCPDCGRAVPRAAMACPNCGRRFLPTPQPQPIQQTQSSTSPVPNWVGILLIALLAATLVLYFC